LKEQVTEQEKRLKQYEEEASMKDKRLMMLENKLNALLAESNNQAYLVDTTDC
jgi:hypothetical protein